jgi:hypothetical protein
VTGKGGWGRHGGRRAAAAGAAGAIQLIDQRCLCCRKRLAEGKPHDCPQLKEMRFTSRCFLFWVVLDYQDMRRTRRLTRRGAWAANVAFIRACQPLPVAR